MVLLLLLEMTDNSAAVVTSKGIAPAWDGAFSVLLLLLEMTDNSAAVVTSKGIAPAWDGAFSADRDGWQ